jgi:small ligand-binding sensory domain FIST
VGVAPADNPSFVLLSDAMSSGINDLLQGLDFAYPGAVKVGGLATGASSFGAGLFCNYELHREGTVGIALSGRVVLEAIVAQGCRPIGNPYRVVEGERNVLMKLEEQGDGSTIRTPLEALQDLYQQLEAEDQELAQHSLFVGIAQSEFKQTLEQGDFLIRNLLGVDPRIGAIAIGDRVRSGQRIQFHLRDARASADDLEALLERYATNLAGPTPSGALLFACSGRGERLYDQPNFDSGLLRQYFDGLPVSGFFCGGEIGPVGSSTFLHGYTSVFALCREP